MIKISAKPHDDLNWQIEGKPSVFEFDLGLDEPYFPIEDELHFQSLAAALSHFTKTVWKDHPEATAILYRGSADFSTFFRWSERQEANYSAWKEGRALSNEAHLKRLFCAEAFVAYFQMLAHRLPDELPITLILDPQNTGTAAETLHLLSPERFEHFTLDSGLHFDSKVGICFPTDEFCSSAILEEIDGLIQALPSFRPVYESLLTEQWDGLDEIQVFSEALTPQGERKLKGFCAAGGVVKRVSGQRDSNPRPTGPKPAALAKLRYAPQESI